jgi:hypothetical protein
VIRKLTSIVLFFLALATLFANHVHSGKARAASPAALQPRATDTKVIAYYFHVTARRAACRTDDSLAFAGASKG